MRKLTQQQKKIIKSYFDKGLLDKTNRNYYSNYNEMYNKLEKINDTEILTQETDRYIFDLKFKN